MLRPRFRAADPRDRRRGGLPRRPDPRSRGREPLRGLRRDARRAVRTGIVILPDVRGLYRFYEELALRFAERGFPAVAFDYFGRTAGVSKRDDDFAYMEQVALTTPEGIQADVGAAVGYLRDAGAVSVFTVGFCFGGRNSWLSAAGGHGLAGAVGFYGMPAERNGLAGPDAARRRDRRADPGAAGRRRPEHHGRAQRGVRRGSHRRGRRARGHHLRRARRTASSTASSRSTRLRRTTRGRARSRSSSATAEPRLTSGTGSGRAGRSCPGAAAASTCRPPGASACRSSAPRHCRARSAAAA